MDDMGSYAYEFIVEPHFGSDGELVILAEPPPLPKSELAVLSAQRHLL